MKMQPLKMQNSKLNRLPIALFVGILFLHAIFQYSSISAVAGHVDKEEKEADPAKSPIQAGASVEGQQDIIINTIDSDSVKPVGSRHLYEQPAESATTTTTTQPKPESRNQEDNSVQSGPIQQQQSDPPIIDHRPSNTELADSSAFAQPPSSSAPQPQTVTVVSAGPAQATNQGQVQMQSIGSQTTNQPVYQQNGPSSNWYPQQLPVFNAYGGQTQNQMQPTNGLAPGNAVAASNQVITLQHPNSINAIISDQQQQQQQLQQQSASSNQQLLQANSQGQLVSVNGQPASVILVGPSNPLNGGRRMAYISNWLKGLSSMLANIFNRRDHGGQIVAAPGGPMGHWIQLGSNSPHWLSQAQTAIQQLQQQQVVSAPGSAPSRFAAFMQGQQATSPSTMAISMQPFVGSQMSNQQVPNGFQTGEMQMSGSSASYIAVQAPQTQNHQQNSQLLSQPSQLSTQQQASINSFQPVNQMSPVSSSDSQISTRSARASPAQTQIQQPSQLASSIQQQVRAGGQQSTAAINQSTRAPTRFGRSSDQNLPLAHYSRLGESRADKV